MAHTNRRRSTRSGRARSSTPRVSCTTGWSHMHEPLRAAEFICTSAELEERGRAVVFDVLLRDGPARAFAMRFDGRLVAYLNRCAHLATEMDWQEGHFLDLDRRWIICSIHGAAYEPAD